MSVEPHNIADSPVEPSVIIDGRATPTPSMIKWTSIELLHHVRRSIKLKRERLGEAFAHPTVTYRAKIKLNGTNAGVQLTPTGQTFAQSRTRIISRNDDNMGFAAWVDDNRSYFDAIDTGGKHVVIFGEWCGRGIQKRTAISRVSRRMFVVFAIQHGDHHRGDVALDIEPEIIRAYLPDHPEVFVLPWYAQPITLDYGDRDALERAVVQINGMVESVENCDPWVAENFGIDGLGEGMVMYPMVEAVRGETRDLFTGLMFKAKGEKHQVVKQRRPVQLDPEVAANVDTFVEMFVTPQRLEQGVAEACGGVYEMKRMGIFLKWMGQDIKKESAAELEASGLAWKDVGKATTKAARRWYKDKVEAI